MNLLSAFGRRGVRFNLLAKKVDVEDTLDTSKYFDVVELDTVFTAGRNPVAFNGTPLLKDKTEIQVECLDSIGNPLYFEQAKSKIAQFTDVSKFVIAIHVYDETYNGPGKLVLMGTTKEGKSVRWVKNISIDKTLTNARKVRFYTQPSLDIRSLLYPVVNLNLAYDEDLSNFRQAKATATLRSYVSLVTVLDGGEDYPPGSTIEFMNGGLPNGSPNHAQATLTIVDGVITSVLVTDGGDGYTSRPDVVVRQPGFIQPGTGANLRATLVREVSPVITITDPGRGYSSAPGVNFSGGGGSGATATADINLEGEVSLITLTNVGGGYTSAPTITIDNPVPVTVSELNVPQAFTASFYSLPVTPIVDSLQSAIDRKRVEIDYRLVATNIPAQFSGPSLAQTGSFNSQMEGKDIELTIHQIRTPLSHRVQTVNLTQTFKIKKVISSTVLSLTDPFVYQVGPNSYVSKILSGSCRIEYDYVRYNTNPDSSLTTPPEVAGDPPIPVKAAYVEATYRNIKPFSGFVARHKLYRRSLFYPGEFQLLSDEPLNSVELLTDTVTFNRTYYRLGQLYHQYHINKYWFTSSNDIDLIAKSNPINSMYVSCGNPENADRTEYTMVKTDTIGQALKPALVNNRYYPYNENEYNQLSGSSYNSNFINLKKDALHVLSFDVKVEKDYSDRKATLDFYFTSSTATVTKENTYDPAFGWKLGTVAVTELIREKYFKETQQFFFTPVDDYYGTLKIVPYHCNVILSNLSLKVYGDSGFSPDVLVIRVPCPLNVQNEAFEFRAELYDINHILIPTDLKAKIGFASEGANVSTGGAGSDVISVTSTGGHVLSNAITIEPETVVSAAGGVSGGGSVTINSDDLTVNSDLYIPGLSTNCVPSDDDRLVVWNGEDGKLSRSDVIRIYGDDEHLILRTGSCNSLYATPVELKSVHVTFDGLNGGRQIYWITGSVKTMESSSN